LFGQGKKRQGTALQIAARLTGQGKKRQGTTLVVPEVQQNQRGL
jgi:hypothetical protein